MRSLYFVGAGFTKGLESRRPVPLVKDFVHILAKYARRDNVAFATLVGLEGMNVFRHHDAILRNLANAGRPKRHRTQILTRVSARPQESIETLLNRAHRMDDALKGLSVKTVLAAINDPILRVQYAINSIFGLIGWRLKLARLIKFLQRQCGSKESTHTFVSFNYDIVLEHALEQAGPWSARRGYGIRFRWTATNDPTLLGGTVVMRAIGGRASQISVLKPHGSLNWLAAKGRDARRVPVVATTQAGSVRYVGVTKPHASVRFPTSWRPVAVTPLIVPPMSAKNTRVPTLRRLRSLETVAIKEADEVFIIGWRMIASDDDQINLIRKAVSARKRPFSRVVVVNLRAGESYYRRIADTFGVRARAIIRFDQGLQDFLQKWR
ncbi:MAG TPA: hypothetical protein VHX14_12930 [Thermoanaerobaculia bacterium]|jgi:hypothetical protein|nr:hypothetical protein [Thermoanaerobaculia bacterium]